MKSAKKIGGVPHGTFLKGIKTIFKYLKPHWKIISMLIFFGLINATAQAFVPLVAGKIFDYIISLAKNTFAPIMPVFEVIAVWLLLQLTSNIIGWRSNFTNFKIAATLEGEYTAKGLGKLLEMPMYFHADQKQGDIVDRINSAANWLNDVVDNVLLDLLPSFLSVIVALIITLFINLQLTLILLMAILIYIFIFWNAAPALIKLQKKAQRAFSTAYGHAWDTLQNIKEVKQASTEKKEQKLIRRNFIKRAAQFWVNINAVSQKLDFSQKTLVTLTQFSIFVSSVFLVRNGTITPGELVAFNGYAAMVFGPFVLLGQNWRMIQRGIVSIVRAEGILNLPTEIYEPKNAVAPKKLKGDVTFDDVYFSYKNSKETLKGISFKAKAGEKIALVGESGVGKTTIIDLISGFYFPQKGRILIDGTNTRKMNLEKYRSRIAVVPQEPTLFNNTVKKNILYGNSNKSEKEIISAAKDAHADEFIQSFPKKYNQVVGWKGIKLSVGQKQRIAIARAFLRNPDILILDEPTSALDAKSEHLIKQSLQKLIAGRTTFIIAHRLSTIREADNILVLKDGKIVEQGKHKDLVKINGGVYKNLYDLQTGLSAQ
ncbi:MAG: ABC transporter ATP-binding protein/permease [Patescibacteria group bacterium]|nr:ABC transporter ATP-binding protein/permease [Patescibacteria group bacterium]